MTDKHQLTISQLAKVATVPATTIRYYERIGLVKPEKRSCGNYRLYGDLAIGKLHFIRAAQAIGFRLDDIRTLLGDGETVPCCGDVSVLIEDRLLDIKRKMKDLRHMQRLLGTALDECRTGNPRRQCHVIASLQKHPDPK